VLSFGCGNNSKLPLALGCRVIGGLLEPSSEVPPDQGKGHQVLEVVDVAALSC
jgi:hypothetical protein